MPYNASWYKTYFADFNGRENELRKVTRYSLYSVMFYRTNLLTHSKHVGWMLNEIVPFAEKEFGSSFDGKKAVLLGLVHDDAEIIFGDVQAGNKSKMTEEELQKIEQAELDAIEKISDRYPKYLGGYVYKDLLYSAMNTNTLEEKIVKYVDKFDAFGEALHEIYGGNRIFATNVVNEYGEIPTPTDFYLDWFSSFHKKHPDMVQKLKRYIPIFGEFYNLDIHTIAAQAIPHTRESLYLPTGYFPYDWWKSCILRSADDEELKNLYRQKETAPTMERI